MKIAVSPVALNLMCLLVAQAQTPGVRVTNQIRVVNGVSQVPPGMFGVHATPLSEETARRWGVEMVRLIHHQPNVKPILPGAHKDVPANVPQVMECFWDRFQPARVLLDKEWNNNLQKLARGYGENAKSTGKTHWVEFWNEPYLNWAQRPGVNYDGAFYEQTNTAEGAPMTIKGWDKPTDFLVWTRQLKALDAENKVDYLATRYAPPQAKEGDTFQWRDKSYRMATLPWGRDTSQKDHWSGQQNSQFYRWMFVPFARALKEANPNVTVIGGWGCHIQYGGWDGWHTLYKPLIDEAHQWLDGLNEHHYGGDTRMVSAAYETAAAYTQTRYGKTLKFFNTEAGGKLDPEQPGRAAQPSFEAKTANDLWGTMTYALRDIIHLLDVCPDKAMSRAGHMAHANGERFALEFLRDLRGTLMKTESDVPNVWAVSSISKEGKMCVVLFNDNNTAVTFPLRIAPPPGGSLDGQGLAKHTVIARDGETLALQEEQLSNETLVQLGAGFNVTLPAKSTAKWVIPIQWLPGAVPPYYAREIQYYSPVILQKVAPGQLATMPISLPAARSEKASYRLRLVFEGSDGNECLLHFNGTAVPLQITNSYIHEWPLDAALVRDENVLRIQSKGTRAIQLNSASLLVETKQ